MRRTCIISLAMILSLQFLRSQGIITHEYRNVAPADMEEYIKRETTYWKVFAENEVKKGNLIFWGIFQRMDGTDLDTGPDFLIINTFKDLDKGADWASIATLFPNVNMEDIQTWGISTTTDRVFISNLPNHIRKPNTVPENDYKFVRVIYHDVTNLDNHLSFEAEKWKPLVERAWQEGKSTMTGWGNGIILLPESEEFHYNSYSYDLFATMQDALSPAFSQDLSIPEDFWTPLEGNYDGPRNAHLYRVVAAVGAPPE